jgi:hypothetical protein
VAFRGQRGADTASHTAGLRSQVPLSVGAYHFPSVLVASISGALYRARLGKIGGWRHAYLNDPDAHEISLYWAGENRMKKTVMRTAKEVDKVPAANGLIEKIPKPKPDFSNLGTLPQSPRDELCRGL